jgi:hypothetical protein
MLKIYLIISIGIHGNLYILLLLITLPCVVDISYVTLKYIHCIYIYKNKKLHLDNILLKCENFLQVVIDRRLYEDYMKIIF